MGVSPLPRPASVASRMFFMTMPPLGGGVRAVVDGGEGDLGAGPGVHGVQVVDQGLHGLVGGPVGLLHRPAAGQTPAAFCHLPRRPNGVQPGAAALGGKIVLAVLQGGRAGRCRPRSRAMIAFAAPAPGRPCPASSVRAWARFWRYSLREGLAHARRPCRSQSSGCSGRRAGRSGWTGWRCRPGRRS